MEREELLRALRRQEVMDNLRCLGCGHEHHCSTKGCTINRAAAELIEQLTAENEVLRHPFNPPLPLEALREMDGEPVWIVPLDGVFVPQWRLVWGKSSGLVFERYGAFWGFDEKEYGKRWLAYRRKPEEGKM